MAPPERLKLLKRTAEGHNPGTGIEMQTLKLSPAKTTGQIQQPVEIGSIASPGELLPPPGQQVCARKL
jgi:hypothetical protein